MNDEVCMSEKPGSGALWIPVRTWIHEYRYREERPISHRRIEYQYGWLYMSTGTARSAPSVTSGTAPVPEYEFDS